MIKDQSKFQTPNLNKSNKYNKEIDKYSLTFTYVRKHHYAQNRFSHSVAVNELSELTTSSSSNNYYKIDSKLNDKGQLIIIQN